MAACALIVPIFLFGLGIWLLSNDLKRTLPLYSLSAADMRATFKYWARMKLQATDL
jgi:hypothetical protein